jgi:hypothetical protein
LIIKIEQMDSDDAAEFRRLAGLTTNTSVAQQLLHLADESSLPQISRLECVTIGEEGSEPARFCFGVTQKVHH